MGYDERRVAPGVEVWTSAGAAGELRILPDGCLDLIFDGARLVVAGPDSAARLHRNVAPHRMTGVRLHAGLGPTLLGLPADELTDVTVPLESLWSDARTRRVTEQVAADPVPALGALATAPVEADPFGFRLRTLLSRGRSVADAADALGYSTRQLHRRSVLVFGYGPQQLSRILRMLRAVVGADAGRPWSEVAHSSGYVDQAHLAREFRALVGVTPTTLRRERQVVWGDSAQSAQKAEVLAVPVKPSSALPTPG